MGVLFAVALLVSGIASRFDDPYRRGLKYFAWALFAIGMVFLVAAPLSFSAP